MDLLFWKEEEIAEFRVEAQLEKAGITPETIRQAEELQRAREAERQRIERSLPAYYSVQAYDRPGDWLPLQMRPGKIGYATKIRRISMVQ